MTREMADPREMRRSWTAANAVAMPMYAAVGFAGMWAFGAFNQGASFFLNFKDEPATAAYLLFASSAGYLPIVYGQICLFLKLELRLAVLPTDWWRVSNPEANRFPGVPPALFRLGFRSAVVAFYVLAAEALLGVGLQNLVSLVGAAAIAAFSFYLPWVLALRLTPAEDLPKGWRLLCIAGTVFGVFLSLAGVYFSLQAMASSDSSGLFSAPCKQNAFFMGEFSVHDAAGKRVAGAGGYSRETGPGTFHDTFYREVCERGRLECSQYGVCCRLRGTEVSCDA